MRDPLWRRGSRLQRPGRAGEAIDIAEPAAVPRVYERAGRYALNFLLTGLGAASLADGRIDDARRSAERVQGKTSLAGERAHLACALALRGDIELAGRKLSNAETAYKDGFNSALDTGMRPIEAQCRQGIGEACLRAHRKADARVEIEAAAKLYDEIGLKTRAVNARALLETN